MKSLVSLEEARATLKVIYHIDHRIDSFNTVHGMAASLEVLNGISDTVVGTRAGLVDRAVNRGLLGRRHLGLELLRLEAGVVAMRHGILVGLERWVDCLFCYTFLQFF